MKALFDGLDDLGFDMLDDMDTFKPEVATAAPAVEVKITANTPSAADCIFEKSYTCPVCEERFRDLSVKTSKVRFESIDDDLMPVHSPVNPFYYNVAICPKCGYAALSDNFLKITESQCELIAKQISPKYKAKQYPFPYTEDMVIERYKFALLNSVVKRGRASEKAYLCLVLSWLYKIKEDEANRLLFSTNAYEAFVEAYTKDTFPIYGMNEVVTAYLVAELARYIGNPSEAMKWLAKVLSSRLATQKVKDMALDLKQRIQKQGLQN